ncbi:MAG: hypothetical protein FWD58_06395 [Firmicutes bacterium]|nr:hypothetical protein [Bacillota bacterium]
MFKKHIRIATLLLIIFTVFLSACVVGGYDKGENPFHKNPSETTNLFETPKAIDNPVPENPKDFVPLDMTQETVVITTAAGLAQLASEVNGGFDTSGKTYVLGNDIDLDVAPYNTGKGWTSIGFGTFEGSPFPFRGVFDGNGKKIAGLFIDNKDLLRVGLFGQVEGKSAKIQNLSLTDVNITSNGPYTGAIASAFLGAAITNCHGFGTINIVSSPNVNTTDVGGLVGDFAAGDMVNCSFQGTVSGSVSVGGLVGCSFGNIANSFFDGDVKGSDGCVGGISGGSYGGDIINCYSAGIVKGGAVVGGILGDINQGTVANCYSTALIGGDTGSIGGIIGRLYSGVIKNCVALNSVVETNAETSRGSLGRVVGQIWDEIWDGKDVQLINNYAIDHMAVKTGGADKILVEGLDAVDGLGIAEDDVLADSFWVDSKNWVDIAWDADIWVLKNGMLPSFKRAMPL